MATRTRARRRIDTLETLQRGGDAWVASANADGMAHLIALAYSWDGERLTVATRVRSKTARNLTRARWARVALDLTGDVVIVEGPLEVIPLDADDALAAAHAAAIGSDFRREPEPHAFFRLTPARVQAMRSPEEQPDRTIMREGRWLGDRGTQAQRSSPPSGYGCDGASVSASSACRARNSFTTPLASSRNSTK